jgi:nucleoside-diphosphate-sugar epimerase
MKLLVTGASGFLGLAMVRCAMSRGHDVRCMIRSNVFRSRLPVEDSKIIHASMTDHARFVETCRDIEAVVHCAAVTSSAGRPDWKKSHSINVTGTIELYRAAEKSGVKRWIQISSMSSHSDSTSLYGRSKLAGDEFLRGCQSSLDWTILRPSLIYGPDERGLVSKTLQLLKKLPVLPIVGSGEELLRPVYVDDISCLALDCISNPETHGKTYMAGGADEVTLNFFMSELCRTFGLKRAHVHLPIWFAMQLSRCAAFFMKNPPITMDNVRGILECARVDQESAGKDVGYAPMGLAEGLTKTQSMLDGS